MKARKIRQLVYLVILIFLISSFLIGALMPRPVQVSAESLQGYTTAKGMAVLEMESGRVLFSKNMDTKLKMASTTKIVTALTVINNCENLDEPFKINNKAVGIEGTSIYLKYNEVLTARELLYGLMLRSGNDASVALALHCANTIEEFAEMMNETAKQCGALNSHFVNPHGLDADEHYTTAYDLALITTKALQNPTFKEIVSTKNIKISGGEQGTRYLVNKNRLLNSLDGCIGVKTGFTSKAGRCLVSAVERDGMTIVAVVLNCGPMFEESTDLLNLAFTKYKNVELLKSYNYICNIPVIDGEKNKVRVYNPKGFSYPLTMEEQSKVSIDYDLPNQLKAPIKAESKVGTAKVYFDDKLLFETDILAMENIESDAIINKIKDIIDKF